MKGIEALENMVAIQSSNGNWNCNPYMWGYANGLILALATMKDEEPKFLEKPNVWLDDLPPVDAQPVCQS